jgi:phenylacetic acid degradation operon negative regulatory protein
MVEHFISTRVESVNISCKSLIVTVFGDVISQHGNWIWLGSLIESLSTLGYSERLVRTSVFRLVEDDWLQVKKIGRKSYYSLTTSATNHNLKASRRIYKSSNSSDNNDWLILLPSFVSEEKLPQLKKQLKWLGFSSISASVYAHPSFDKTSLEETIKELDLFDSVVIFSGQTIDEHSNAVLKKLVFQKWQLSDLQNKYDQFINDYLPILDSLKNNDSMMVSSKSVFFIRLLLIHEFRRILLKDHELSINMLPSEWSGIKARKLVIKLYSFLEKKSITYITQNLLSFDGNINAASETFYTRFK